MTQHKTKTYTKLKSRKSNSSKFLSLVPKPQSPGIPTFSLAHLPAQMRLISKFDRLHQSRVSSFFRCVYCITWRQFYRAGRPKEADSFIRVQTLLVSCHTCSSVLPQDPTATYLLFVSASSPSFRQDSPQASQLLSLKTRRSMRNFLTIHFRSHYTVLLDIPGEGGV